jgi:hypothetical protein
MSSRPVTVVRPMLMSVQNNKITVGENPPKLNVLSPVLVRHALKIFDDRWLPVACAKVRRVSGFSLQGLPRPSAVETDTLGAVRVQDVRGHVPLLTLFRKDHDHEPTCAHVVDVMAQIPELLSRPRGANQCPLELREESLLCACRIQATQIFLSVKDVNIVRLEPGT